MARRKNDCSSRQALSLLLAASWYERSIEQNRLPPCGCRSSADGTRVITDFRGWLDE
jgi:hypothetical protein